MGSYPWVPPYPSVMGWGTKIEGGVDSNGWVRAGVRDEISVQNIYCSKTNTKPDTHYGSQVCNGIGYQAPQSNLE